MHNILIGICSGGTVHAETVTSLFGAMETLRAKNVGYSLVIQSGGYKPLNMNVLVAKAKEIGATHLMSIDNDMMFPTSGILRLLDNDKDIVGANYNVRGNTTFDPGNEFTIKQVDPRKVKEEDKGKKTEVELPSTLFKCWSLGLGFTLIRLSVFDKITRPYFLDYIDPVSDEHHTEDVEFFTKCQDAGLEVWCNPTIEMGHIGSYIY